jgi:protein NrfD
MTLSSILVLFLTHLGIGLAFTLLFVSREAGVKFFRFNTGLAALFIGIGLAFRQTPASNILTMLTTTALALAGLTLIVYWATVGRMWARIRPMLLPAAGFFGVVAIVGQALEVQPQGAIPPGLTTALIIASFLSSAALLGGTCGAMILGHWYLVIPSMNVTHLQAITKWHIASMIVRIVIVTTVVFLAIVSWQPGMGPSFERYILSTSGIFFWQRVLFGLVGPLVLSYLTWETAKIQSTQSATGILYVDFFTVVVGEVLAKYLLLSTSVPV